MSVALLHVSAIYGHPQAIRNMLIEKLPTVLYLTCEVLSVLTYKPNQILINLILRLVQMKSI
jgi:hypothetical protein